MLPALLLFALLLQQADEVVQLLDERRGVELEKRRVAAYQRWAQRVVPALLDLLVTLQQRAAWAVFQHGFEGLAVETALQAARDRVNLVGRRGGGEFPAQVVGLHAY